MWILASGLGFIALFALLHWRFGEKAGTTFGSAHWCDVWTLFRKGHFRRGGIRVGDYCGRQSIFYDGVHAVTIGENGSGKGTAAIVPNLLSLGRVLLIDPGGENTAIVAKHWREQGRAFFCFNPFGMFTDAPWALPQHGFNPLDYLDPSKDSLQADAKVMAEMLIQRSGNEIGNDLYFLDQAEDFLQAALLYLKLAQPREKQHLGVLYKMMNGTADDWSCLLADMQDFDGLGGIVRERALALDRIEQQSDKEFSAIMSSLQKNISWLADSALRAHMERSDFDFGALKGLSGEGDVLISVVLPMNFLSSHAAILRLATACAVIQMQSAPFAKEKIVFLIDEAFALGKLKSFEVWLATLRKYKIAIWSIWQNIGQIEQLYGKNWETVLSNAGLIQLMSAGDLRTAKYVQELLGQCTVTTTTTSSHRHTSTSQTSRSLRFATEIMRPADENEQIAFIGKLPPARLKKTPYFMSPDLVGRYARNPHRDEEPGDVAFSDKAAALAGRVQFALVWCLAPHPIAAWVMLGAVGLAAKIAFGG